MTTSSSGSSSIKAIFFDLDDTLIDDHGSATLCAAEACKTLQAAIPGFDRELVARTYGEISLTFWQDRSYGVTQYGTGQTDIRITNWNRSLELCNIRAPGLGAELAAMYEHYRRETVIPFNETIEVLETLRGRYRLGVITNGDGVSQRYKLELAGLDRYFDTVIASGDLGAAKPEAAIFQAAASRLEVDPAAAWHIGDNLRTDVGGAIGAGFSAVWLNRNGRAGESIESLTPGSYRELPSLRELLTLLS